MSTSSLVLDIRKKTTQERLRGDHIDLLYQYEEALKLNDEYEKRIDELKAIIASSQQPVLEVVEKDSAETIDFIESLHSKLNTLENELKTMKTKEVLTQKSYKKHIESVESDLLRLKQEEEHIKSSYELRIHELEEDLATATASSLTATLQNNDKCGSLQLQDSRDAEMALASLEKKNAQLELSLNESKEIIRQSEKFAKEREATLANEATIYLKQKSVILELENEKTELTRQLSEAQLLVREMTRKLIAPAPSTSSSGVVTANAFAQTEENSSHDKDKDASLSAANHFKDYVQLKKENTLLKLQLAHKETPPGQSRRGSSGNPHASTDNSSGSSMLLGNKSASSGSGKTTYKRL